MEDKSVSLFDIYLLGISITLGCQTFAWNMGLPAGAYEFFGGIIISAAGYFCLTLCVSEMMSALPFSGGIYGLARVALNPAVGFLIGLLESIKNIFHISCCVLPLARYISFAAESDPEYEPLYWVIILGVVIALLSSGSQVFWTMNRILGIGSIGLVILYLCSPLFNETDFEMFAQTNMMGQKITEFNKLDFFRYLPIMTWFFMGVELLPFACVDSKNAVRDIPRAMIALMITLILSAFPIYFSVVSQYPGINWLPMMPLPLLFGYCDMLDLTYQKGAWFTIISVFTTVFGFMFGCSRQIASLGSSGLFPKIFEWKTSTKAPIVALLFTALFCFITMLIIRYVLNNNMRILFYICILDSIFSYISVFITYLYFKKKYTTLKREFTNPFGEYAAYFGILIFLLLAAAILGLQEGSTFISAPISFGIFVIVGIIYYYGFIVKYQHYSPEEQKAFLIAYVINSNTRGRKKLDKKKKESRLMDLFKSPKDVSLTETAKKYLNNSSHSNLHSSVRSIGSSGSVHSIDFNNFNQEKYQDKIDIHDSLPPSNKQDVGVGQVPQAKPLPEMNRLSSKDNHASIKSQSKKVQFVEMVTKAKHNSIDFSTLPTIDLFKEQGDEELDEKISSETLIMKPSNDNTINTTQTNQIIPVETNQLP